MDQTKYLCVKLIARIETNNNNKFLPLSFQAFPGRFPTLLEEPDRGKMFFCLSTLLSDAATNSGGTNKANADASRFHVIKKKELAVIQNIQPSHHCTGTQTRLFCQARGRA